MHLPGYPGGIEARQTSVSQADQPEQGPAGKGDAAEIRILTAGDRIGTMREHPSDCHGGAMERYSRLFPG